MAAGGVGAPELWGAAVLPPLPHLRYQVYRRCTRVLLYAQPLRKVAHICASFAQSSAKGFDGSDTIRRLDFRFFRLLVISFVIVLIGVCLTPSVILLLHIS